VVSGGHLTGSLGGLGQGSPAGDGAVGLVGFPSGADGGVEVEPLLGFVLGFVQVADRAKAVGGPARLFVE
jgi:hypothetical protein